MNKRIIAGLFLNIVAAIFFTATINAAPAPGPGGYHKDIRKHEVHKGKHSGHHYHHGIRHTKAELKKDRVVRNYHLRHGHKAAAAHKQYEIRHDKRELRHERRHKAHGGHHRHHNHHGYHHHN